MPVSTARFRFEYRLLDWAEASSRAWTGARVEFFVALREDGSLRRIYFGTPNAPWDGEQKTSMAQASPRWFLYLPDEEPGRGYLEWSALPVAVVRTWLDRAVQAADLADVGGGAPLDHWPEGWRVVLG